MIQRLTIFFIVTFILSASRLNAQQTTFAIYWDGGVGAWEDGVKAFENVLDWKDISHARVDALEINQNDLRPLYQAIYFPGGFAWYYKAAIDSNGLRHIRELVQDGGSYLGICAGAYFASDSVYWEEDGLIDYPLNLFDGVAKGAIDAIAPWDDYTMTTLTMQPDNPINQYEPGTERMLYYGGPVFLPHHPEIIDTTATWAAYNDSLAMINFTYGSGRVLLLGPHPEIEEDSDRDSSNFAQELDDAGSDWPFLWSAVDWLLGLPISYPPPSSFHRSGKRYLPQSMLLSAVHPNPLYSSAQGVFRLTLRQTATVSISLFNIRGQRIQRIYSGKLTSGSHTFRLSGINRRPLSLPTGVYIVRVSGPSGRYSQKFIVTH